MPLLLPAGGLLAVYAVLRSFVVPRLVRRLTADRSPNSPRTVAGIAVAGTLQSACLIAGLTAAVLAAGLFVLLQIRPTTAPELADAIGTLQGWRRRVVGVG